MNLSINNTYINNPYINNINDKKIRSEKLNIINDDIKFDTNISKDKNSNFVDNKKINYVPNYMGAYTKYEDSQYPKYEIVMYKIIDKPLENVFEGIGDENSNFLKARRTSVDKFFTNIANSYYKEKTRIETNFTGIDKENELSRLSATFDYTVNQYIEGFSDKGSCGAISVLPQDFIKEAITSLSNKTKEYIDSGNKPPSNLEEFKNFNEYISSDNNTSLDTLSKIELISKNMEEYIYKDENDFEIVNEFLDDLNLPKDVTDYLKLINGANKMSFNLKTTIIGDEKDEDSSNLIALYKISRKLFKDDYKKEYNKKYNENFLDILVSENRLNKNLFSKTKTDSQKYAEYIKEMKFKNINNSLKLKNI